MSRLTRKGFQIVQTIVQFEIPTLHSVQFKVDIIVHQSQLFYGRVWAYVLTRFSHLIVDEKKDCAGSRFQNCSDRALLLSGCGDMLSHSSTQISRRLETTWNSRFVMLFPEYAPSYSKTWSKIGLPDALPTSKPWGLYRPK